MADQNTIEQAILRLTAARGSSKSICPSEVARELSDGDTWRSLMTDVRHASIALSRAGRIAILRKGKPVAPEDVRGVIRLQAREGGTE